MNKIFTTGISEKIQIFKRNFVLTFLSDVEAKLEEIIYLNKEPKKNKLLINKLADDVVYDKKLHTLNSNELIEDVYKPAFRRVLEVNNLERCDNVPFCIRINIPSYDYYFIQWHQDSGTFMYNQKGDIFNYKCFALWTAITDSDKNNGIELIPKNQHEDKIYNANHKINAATRPPFNYRVVFNNSSLPHNIDKIHIESFNAGEGIIFDSLVFHRTAINRNAINQSFKIRLSFDIRFYCPEERFKINKVGMRNAFKRYFYNNFNLKIPYI